MILENILQFEIQISGVVTLDKFGHFDRYLSVSVILFISLTGKKKQKTERQKK